MNLLKKVCINGENEKGEKEEGGGGGGWKREK